MYGNLYSMDELFPSVPAPRGARQLNNRYAILAEDDFRVVFVGGEPIVSFHIDDVGARDLAMVQLCLHSGLSERQVAFGFEVSRPTVSRAKKKYADGGVPALVPRVRGPRGPSKLKGAKVKAMVRMARDGHSKVEIGARLGVNESSVRKALRRLGLDELAVRQPTLPYERETEEPTAEPQPQQEALAAVPEQDADAAPRAPESASSAQAAAERSATDVTNHGGTREKPSVETQAAEYGDTADEPGARSEAGLKSSDDVDLPVEWTSDVDPDNRVMDRFLARMGLLSDAAPLFADHEKVSRVGLLLAVPILVTHHVFKDAMETFDGIGPAFYGLRNSVLSLLMMFLSRIGRPEALKEHAPGDLGAVLGLDRFPEMKTLRRKIAALATQNKSLAFMKRLSERHLKRIKGAHLWLYLDGHVSVYSGKRKLKKNHVTRLRMSLPSILDYWVNDEHGDPLLVVTAVRKKGMKALLPMVVRELRAQGEERPITVIFDREGWSPEMFATLDAMDGVTFLTYRKAQANNGLPRLPVKDFEWLEEKLRGERVGYSLSDKGIYIDYGPKRDRKRLKLRQVTRRTEDGHQTHIVTNDRDSAALDLADRMFRRWGQENFFKYMGNEMELNGLYTYAMEDGDGERLVPNPKRKSLDKKIKRLEKERTKLMNEYGERALTNEEQRRRTMRGFKIANGSLAREISQVSVKLDKLEAQKASLPATVPVKETLSGQKAQQCRVETRRLLHCFRIAAYRTESALRELVRPHYRRWRQDGRTIIQSMLQSKGNIEVTESELRVVLEPQSAPHRTQAMAVLCDELNSLDTKFPGSDLHMRFAVRDVESVS